MSKKTVAGIIVFVLLVAAISTLVVLHFHEGIEGRVSQITVEGASLHTASDYLEILGFAAMPDTAVMQLSDIKEKFMLYPYVESVQVLKEGSGAIRVQLTEKRIQAVVQTKEKLYFLSKNLELVPIQARTVMMDYPFILNSSIAGAGDIDPVRNSDVLEASDIINVAGLVDKKLAATISDIDLRAGKEIVLSLRDRETGVIYGNRNPVQKMLLLRSVLENHNDIVRTSRYIDLRFDKHVFVGLNRKEES